MLAAINPVALPALRIAATFFLLINLVGGTYIFRNRHRFFDQDSKCGQRHSRRSQVEDGSRYDSLASFDHASCYSSNQFLAGLIKGPRQPYSPPRGEESQRSLKFQPDKA